MKEISEIRLENTRDLAAIAGGTGAFAARIDREPTQASRFMGKNPTKKIGDRLARHIETSFEKPKGWLDTQHHLLEGIEEWTDGDALSPDEVEVPFYGEVALSAGSGATAFAEISDTPIRFTKKALRKADVTPAAAVCCKITGDSMEPILPDGAVVGIDTNRTDIIDGKMYAVEHGGLLRIKFLQRLPDRKVLLRSANSIYGDDTVSLDDNFRVLGCVFWSAAFWS